MRPRRLVIRRTSKKQRSLYIEPRERGQVSIEIRATLHCERCNFSTANTCGGCLTLRIEVMDLDVGEVVVVAQLDQEPAS